MTTQPSERTLALAAVVQAAELVRRIASRQPYDIDDYALLLNGVSVTSPDDVYDVYHSVGALATGVKSLQLMLTGAQRQMDTATYTFNMLNLSVKLLNHKEALKQLSRRIEQLDITLQHYDIFDTETHRVMADIYSQAISPLSSRIKIHGERQVLSQLSNQHLIRAVLLAGVRAAVLWRQLGGRRRQMLFGRRQLTREINTLNQQLR